LQQGENKRQDTPLDGQAQRKMMKELEPEDKILDSWKEIAAFLRRGVRTVQRWERTEGLPVRRQHHVKKGTVFALRSELERWRNSTLVTNDEVVVPASPFVPGYAVTDGERLRQLCIVARRQAEMTRNRVKRPQVKLASTAVQIWSRQERRRVV
jgi:hypothetical protein